MTGKRIVLAEWHWIGHHPTFFAYFILALEELGAEVLAICPHPEEARETVAQLREARASNPARAGQTAYRQMVITRKRFGNGRLSRLGGIYWSFQHFRFIENEAKKWQADSGKPVDLIFYACMHEWDFDAFWSVRPFLSLPWAGLYLHLLSIRMPGRKIHTGRVPRPERIFRGSLCRGVATFDENIVPQFSAAIGKPVVAFPDLADERLSSDNSKRMLESRLRNFAAGRPIVGLFGYLLKSKGVFSLVRVAEDPKMSGTCFAFVGEMVWSSFSPPEAEKISSVLSAGANTWNHLMRIPSEAQLNALISGCDVIYAVYLDFPSSSNILAKAALFKKPVIVSDGHLMAERVRRFNMGEVVPQGDVEAIAAAIEKITKNPAAWLAEKQPRWSDYTREHSFERLEEAFRELLATPAKGSRQK